MLDPQLRSDRFRFDAETLIGFYRYFPFPLSDLQPLFPYCPEERMQAAWRQIQEFYGGEGGEGLGITADPFPPSPTRTTRIEQDLPLESD